ncbi:MAG: PilT/PilU family type 4a pilus ATPase [Selenomonadaceae bacterium]|nr:PilT/PilU family type 4a pilus ATPase [Selenomonadaceae bacterium]
MEQLAMKAREIGASDIHLTVGQPPFLRCNGELIIESERSLMTDDLNRYLELMLSPEQRRNFIEQRELDFSWSIDHQRFRVNAYFQRGMPSLAFRLIPSTIPTLDQIGAPKVLSTLINSTQGMLLVTGRTGAGKSTTLAAFIKEITQQRRCHVLTLEDPLEFEHSSEQCFISQRELGRDFNSFPQALRSALREMPDVLLVGEIRDQETMAMSMEAAAAGIFVLGTLHTKGAAETAMRVESLFPIDRRDAIRDQFADVFTAIVSQQLIRSKAGGRVCAAEVLLATPASRSLIRQGKYIQLESVMMSGRALGMQTMSDAVERALKR